jgi:hypothetical protein
MQIFGGNCHQQEDKMNEFIGGKSEGCFLFLQSIELRWVA